MKKINVNDSLVISRIFMVRGQKVMLDDDLAEMYGVSTSRLNEQVKRNKTRFPSDFMFKLSDKEFTNLKSQNATSSWGGRRKLPSAFTEHGVLMLSSVLNSKTSIQVNIKIMRVFNRMREMVSTHKDILIKLQQLERSIHAQDSRGARHERDIQAIFNALKQLLKQPQAPRKKIGYRI